VDHGVAVGAYRAQVVDRVHLVGRRHSGQFKGVVNVDKVLAEPRALPARQEVHLHFHGVTAEDVAAILADVNRDHGQGELGADQILPKVRDVRLGG